MVDSDGHHVILWCENPLHTVWLLSVWYMQLESAAPVASENSKMQD